MKATELRIGNLVLLDTGQTLPYPHAIMPSDLDLIHNDNLPKYASIEPIPLTEEWLLKLKEYVKFPDWIDYVHEAQNWYYWNNNKKELEFNL